MKPEPNSTSAHQRRPLNATGTTGGFVISAGRVELASWAQYEIAQIALLVRDALTELDAQASMPLRRAPALLNRIELLTDVTSECLRMGDDRDDAALNRIVMEAGHV